MASCPACGGAVAGDARYCSHCGASLASITPARVSARKLVSVLFSDVRDTDPSVPERLGVGPHTFEITIPPRLLAPTTYLLSIAATIRYDERLVRCTTSPVITPLSAEYGRLFAEYTIMSRMYVT